MAPPSEINAFDFEFPIELNTNVLQQFQQTLKEHLTCENTRNYILNDLVCFLTYISEPKQEKRVTKKWSKYLTRKDSFMYGPITWLTWFQGLGFQQQQTLIHRLWELIEDKALTIECKEHQLIHLLHAYSFPRSTKLTRLETEVLNLAIKKQNVSASELAKIMNKSTQLLSRTLKRLLEKNYMTMTLEPIYPRYNLKTYLFIIEHDKNIQATEPAWGVHEDWVINHYQSADNKRDIIEVLLPQTKAVTFEIMKWINNIEARPEVERVIDLETFPFGELSYFSIIPRAFHKIEKWTIQEREPQHEAWINSLYRTDEVHFDAKLEDEIVQRGIQLLLEEGYLPIRIIEQRLNLSYRNAKALRSFILDEFISMLILPGTNYQTSMYYLIAETDKGEHEELVNFLASFIPFQRTYRGKGQGYYTISLLYYVSYQKNVLLQTLEEKFDFRMSLIEIPIPPYPLKTKEIPFNRLEKDFSWQTSTKNGVFTENITLFPSK